MFLRASRHATAFLRRSNAVSGSKASFAEHLAAKTAEKARFPAENQLDAPDEAAFGMKLPRFDRLERENGISVRTEVDATDFWGWLVVSAAKMRQLCVLTCMRQHETLGWPRTRGSRWTPWVTPSSSTVHKFGQASGGKVSVRRGSLKKLYPQKPT